MYQQTMSDTFPNPGPCFSSRVTLTILQSKLCYFNSSLMMGCLIALKSYGVKLEGLQSCQIKTLITIGNFLNQVEFSLSALVTIQRPLLSQWLRLMPFSHISCNITRFSESSSLGKNNIKTFWPSCRVQLILPSEWNYRINLTIYISNFPHYTSSINGDQPELL